MTFLHRVFLSSDRTLDRIDQEKFSATFVDAMKGCLTGGDARIQPEGESSTALLERMRVDALRDSTVTIVLIGCRTWALARVDAEIRASIRQTAGHERSGLLGILLPAYEPLPDRHAVRMATDPGRATWCHGNVPESLWRNVATGYASIRPYPRGPLELSEWIRAAYLRRYGTATVDETGTCLRADHPPRARAWTDARDKRVGG